MSQPEPVAVSLTVNGKKVQRFVEPRMLLVHFIREELSLTGTHIGCDTSHCGACTIELDGMSVKSCTMFAVQADGGSVRTIEGMAAADGTLHPLQNAFRQAHGLQCGFCTPGMIMRAAVLLRKTPTRPRTRSAPASPAISAAAPATRTSSRRSSLPPPR